MGKEGVHDLQGTASTENVFRDLELEIVAVCALHVKISRMRLEE